MQELCKIPSPPGKEDRILAFTENFLHNYGYKTKIDDGNLILNPKSDLFVTTHLDSVGEARFEYDGRYFYGISVCDAKASIAAILQALSKIHPKNLNFGVALLSDEEAGGSGSKKFTAKYKPKAAIVMEPTSLKVANVHYGNLEIEVLTKTPGAHGSMHGKKNAIDLCIEVISSLKTSCQVKPAILQIQGGSDDYILPSECKAKMDFLIPPAFKASEILSHVSEVIKGISRQDSSIEYRVSEFCDPFQSVRVHELLANSLEISGFQVEFTEMRSWTDGVNLKATADVVVWGPGDLEFCHTEREKVDVREILKASNVLVSLNALLESESVF